MYTMMFNGEPANILYIYDGKVACRATIKPYENSERKYNVRPIVFSDIGSTAGTIDRHRNK